MVLQWDHPHPFVFQAEVMQTDIDALGHTNNTVYNGWCEQAAWAHSHAMGLDADNYHRLQRAMAIQQAVYQYLAPSFVGERIIVGTWLTDSDRRLTMQRSFQVCNEDTGVCLLRGQWQLVCINLTSNKPTRMPEEFKTVYLPHVITAEQDA